MKPDEAIQCSKDADCIGALGGRVCREGFCVLADDTDGSDGDDDDDDDAASGSSGQAADAGGDASPSGDSGPGDLLTPHDGDVVLLLPDTIVAEGTSVAAWNNAVPGTTLRQAVAEDLDGGPGRPGLHAVGGDECVEIGLYQRLVMADDSGGSFAPADDFSVSTVVRALDATNRSSGGVIPVGRFTVNANSDGFEAIGWGLRTAWQEGDGESTFNRFGASIDTVGGVIGQTTVVEQIDSAPHDDAPHVLALTVRTSGSRTLQLWVDGVAHGSPKAYARSQPGTAPLTLGSLLGYGDYQWAAFEGDLCAVIVHHGAETDEAFGARQQALKTRFAIP